MGKFVKFDSERSRLDLLQSGVIVELGQILRMGAEKYSPNNWKNCPREEVRERYVGAALRHTLAYLGGETNDPESGRNHAIHAMCSLMFVAAYDLDPSLGVKAETEVKAKTETTPERDVERSQSIRQYHSPFRAMAMDDAKNRRCCRCR